MTVVNTLEKDVNGKTVYHVGRDFVEAVSGQDTWNIEALNTPYRFVVRFDVDGEIACKEVANILLKHGIKYCGFRFQRA